MSEEFKLDGELVMDVRRRRVWAKPNGYMSIPGTGPQGETCKSCRHSLRMGSARRAYYKCALLRHAWTCSTRTDILAGSPACNKWEAVK
jgi:hypothetical protein